MEFPGPSTSAGALYIGDNLRRRGKTTLGGGVGSGNHNLAVWFGEEGGDLRGLLTCGCESEALGGPLGAGVVGGGDGFGNRF